MKESRRDDTGFNFLPFIHFLNLLNDKTFDLLCRSSNLIFKNLYVRYSIVPNIVI